MSIFASFFRSRPKLSTASTEFLPFIDAITQSLRACGFTSDADRLRILTHEMAWTTSTEFLCELGVALRDIRRTRSLPSDVSADIRDALRAINRALRLP
jgi:hypothetical protein